MLKEVVSLLSIHGYPRLFFSYYVYCLFGYMGNSILRKRWLFLMGEGEPKVVLKRVCSQRSYDLLPTYPQKENWEIKAFVVPPNSMGRRKNCLCLVQSPRLKLKRFLREFVISKERYLIYSTTNICNIIRKENFKLSVEQCHFFLYGKVWKLETLNSV